MNIVHAHMHTHVLSVPPYGKGHKNSQTWETNNWKSKLILDETQNGSILENSSNDFIFQSWSTDPKNITCG